MKDNNKKYILTTATVMVALFVVSLVVGDFPLTLDNLLNKDELSLGVFFTLRLPRTVMALVAGFGLATTGYVYQTILKNPIAAPDVIGVSSGASVGSGIGIVFFGGGVLLVAVFSFVGGMLAVLLTVVLAKASKEMKIATLVLSGIAVNAFAQAVLMIIKISADPERQLAALEYWTMGSLSGITQNKALVVVPIIVVSCVVIYKFNRQMLLLSIDSDTAKMLGVDVFSLRIILMVVATVIVGAVVSVSGLITFIGLISPHLARLIMKMWGKETMVFAGLIGGCILLFSDILVRGIFDSDIPISVVTSIIGVPFLISLIVKGEKI